MGLMGSVGPAYLCPAAPVLRGGAALGMAGGDVSAVCVTVWCGGCVG